MKQFEIRVRTSAGSKGFIVKPTIIGQDTHYEIWEDNRHLFTLECCIDDHNGKSLKLTEEFSHKEIYPGLVQALSDVIFPKGKAI